MASMKKRAQSAKSKEEQEGYSCTNQEVLNALFIGHGFKNNTVVGGSAIPNSETQYVVEISDDSSAEEETDLLRQHSRLVKQQDFTQFQHEGYIIGTGAAESSQINQLDNSSRQNLLESGSLQVATSNHSPNKSANESPGVSQPQNRHASTIQDGFQQNGSAPQSYNQGFNGGSLLFSEQKNLVKTPQSQHQMFERQIKYGGGSHRALRPNSKGSSGGKRGRPISAFPLPGSYPGFLSQIGESIESTQASHLSKFTHSLARNNASRKQYVPHNIDTFEKEKLYTETITLKKQRNDIMQQCTLLKTHLKTAEIDLRKKDLIIQQLTTEMKQEIGSHSMQNLYQFAAPGQYQFIQTTPELQALQGSPLFRGSRHSKQLQSVKSQQLVKQNAEFRKRIKEIKCDLALKEAEVQNLQRTLKFTKLKEYEIELQTYSQEVLRMKQLWLNEKAQPRIDPAQYQALQVQMMNQRQQLQQAFQQNEQQRQEIEKLKQAIDLSKQKINRQQVKIKRLVSVRKRQETKIKILELKNEKISVEAAHGQSFKLPKMSTTKKQSGKQVRLDNNEFQDQLQNQLEINQILIDKLDMMGVDVHELIRSSTNISPTDINQNRENQNVRMVIFTFVGPEGLIEGGDNQQFEMPIDFNIIVEVEQIKEVLKKELVMDQGIDLILREKQSGQILDLIEDVHSAVDSGEGVLVQFVEKPAYEAEKENKNMENINEEDEKTEYSDEQFEEEETHPIVQKVSINKVANVLKQVRLLFIIKKVPRSHMVKYLLYGEQLDTNENKKGEDIIRTKNLVSIFERKFNFGNSKATKLARFFVEGPPQSATDTQIVEKDHVIDRESLIMRFRDHITDYSLYNQLAIESCLTRLQGMIGGKTVDLLDDLNLDDEDSNGFLPFEQIQKVWKYSGLPKLDEELTEFTQFLALRSSKSLKKVNYQDFCKVFQQGYTLEDCFHDDETPFEADGEDPDSHDLEIIRKNREEQNQQDHHAGGGQTQGNPEEDEEPEIESDDLMIYIDEALFKIVSKLPEKGKKRNLNKNLLPLAQTIVSQQTNETLLVLQPQIFIQFMVQTLGVDFTDKELYCLLHILVREQDNFRESEQNQETSFNQTQDNAGYILYRDVYTLIRNYLRKEKIMKKSISLGLDYKILSKTTFDFLLRIKQALNNSDDKGKKQTDSSQDFRQVFAKDIKTKRMNQQMSVALIEFDDLFDGLFMKYKIKNPPKETLDHLKILLCVQFGLNVNEKCYFLVQKVERVLYDLDYIYVNLVKILREPNHEKMQAEAAKILKQRYDFVARGISKSAAVENPKKNPRDHTQAKGKPRPVSSKPRKQNNSQKKSIEDEASRKVSLDDEDIVDEEEDQIEDDGGIEEDFEARDEHMEDYDRHQTKDIGFDRPVDDDDDDADDDYEDDIENDVEDDEAQPINSEKEKKNEKRAVKKDDFIDEDDFEESPPVVFETKTLKNTKVAQNIAFTMPLDNKSESENDGAFDEEIIDDNYEDY